MKKKLELTEACTNVSYSFLAWQVWQEKQLLKNHSLVSSKYKHILESTELSKAFAKQGLKIPIRNDGKPDKLVDQHTIRLTYISLAVRARKSD